MLIPVVLMPLLSCVADHHQRLGSSNALLLQQHYLLLEPIEPPNTTQVPCDASAERCFRFPSQPVEEVHGRFHTAVIQLLAMRRAGCSCITPARLHVTYLLLSL